MIINEIGQRAVKHYGAEIQVNIAIEECAELIQALCHFKRERGSQEDVCEEIADVYISLLSLWEIFPSVMIDRIVDEKTERLLRRIQREKYSP